MKNSNQDIDDLIALFNSDDIGKVTKAAYLSLNLNYEEDIPFSKVEPLVEAVKRGCNFMFKQVCGIYAPSTLQITDMIHKLYYALVEYGERAGLLEIDMSTAL